MATRKIKVEMIRRKMATRKIKMATRKIKVEMIRRKMVRTRKRMVKRRRSKIVHRRLRRMAGIEAEAGEREVVVGIRIAPGAKIGAETETEVAAAGAAGPGAEAGGGGLEEAGGSA